MKKKVVQEVDVVVKVVESKKCFKLRVVDDTRLKTVANKLCLLMDLDPFSTEWMFFTDNDMQYEVPISFTLRQVEYGRGGRVFLAKIMSTTVKKDYFVETKIEAKLESHWRRRIEQGSELKKEAGVQTDEHPLLRMTSDSSEPIWYESDPRRHTIRRSELGLAAPADKPKKHRLIYTMYGIEDPNKMPPRSVVKKENLIDGLWENLAAIEQSRIMRGLNVVGYCTNEKCINFHRWITVGLGYGR